MRSVDVEVQQGKDRRVVVVVRDERARAERRRGLPGARLAHLEEAAALRAPVLPWYGLSDPVHRRRGVLKEGGDADGEQDRRFVLQVLPVTPVANHIDDDNLGRGVACECAAGLRLGVWLGDGRPDLQGFLLEARELERTCVHVIVTVDGVQLEAFVVCDEEGAFADQGDDVAPCVKARLNLATRVCRSSAWMVKGYSDITYETQLSSLPVPHVEDSLAFHRRVLSRKNGAEIFVDPETAGVEDRLVALLKNRILGQRVLQSRSQRSYMDVAAKCCLSTRALQARAARILTGIDHLHFQPRTL